MRFTKQMIIIILMAAGVGMTTLGCGDDTAEEAGEEIDQSIEQGAEKLEEAGDAAKESVD